MTHIDARPWFRLYGGSRLASAAVTGALCLAGCHEKVAPPRGQAPKTVEAPQRGGWLRVATYTDLRTLDSALAFDEGSHAIEQLIYARLIDFSRDGSRYIPDLAESWSISTDGRTYTFHLRASARFHDGNPVRAADVKRSLERLLHPKTPCPVASFYSRIKGFKEYTRAKASGLSGVRVINPLTLTIELSEADSTFLAIMALPTAAILCQSAGSRYERSFSNKPCGAGPYQLQSWQHGRRIRLKRFDGYYKKGRPYLDGIEWQLRVPVFSQRLKFERGELDWVRELSEHDRARFKASSAWRGMGEWEHSKTIRGVFMNTEIAPFNNVNVRRAVAAAINRKHLAMLRLGGVKAAHHLLPGAIKGHRNTGGQRYDYGKALGYMKAAGYAFDPKTGKGGYPKVVDYYTVGSSFGQTAAELIQQDLAKIGLRIRIRGLGWPAYLAITSRRKQAPMGSDGWSADFPSPANFFESLFVQKAIADEESQNRAFYANPAFDALIDKARHATEETEQLRLYHKAEDMLIDEAPWAFTHSTRRFELWHNYVRGYKMHRVHSSALGDVWLAKAHQRKVLSSGGSSGR